jgi:hypothetical protein
MGVPGESAGHETGGGPGGWFPLAQPPIRGGGAEGKDLVEDLGRAGGTGCGWTAALHARPTRNADDCTRMGATSAQEAGSSMEAEVVMLTLKLCASTELTGVLSRLLAPVRHILQGWR